MAVIEPTVEDILLSITREFLKETHHDKALRAVRLDARLDGDLGIGSLERVELFNRIEKALEIELPTKIMGEARTLEDIAIATKSQNPQVTQLKTAYVPQLEISQVDPNQINSLVTLLMKYAELEPNRPHIYLQDDYGAEHTITYGQLLQNAQAVANGLLARGLGASETVAIMLPTCDGFFYSFFGVLLAGGIPVPIYPPFRAAQIESYAQREAKILNNAEVRILITFPQVLTFSKLFKAFCPSLFAVDTVDHLMSLSHTNSIIVNSDPHDAALIQYTSGSTSDPKGVLLSHSNLIANIKSIGEAVAMKPTDVGVSWLPLYHDMGLIGTWLSAFFNGIPVTIMSPLVFLNRPERWLWAIHYHRATLSGAPNFAYELCVRKISDKAIQGLDLSSWRAAFNGAEAVNPKTIERFYQRFAPYGFREETMYPVYGLAENCVALTFPPLGRAPIIDKIERQPFEQQRLATPATNNKQTLAFVSCGKPIPHHEVRIVNEQGKLLAEREIGRIQFRGPSVMQGYYCNPTATAQAYCEGWLDSGDLGYQVAGELYITGRRKDVIIKGGRNLYPEEVEEVGSHVEGVRQGCILAFGSQAFDQGTENLIVVAETREAQRTKRQKMKTAIIERVTEVIGIPPDQVILVAPRTIPKTSSGKLQRAACKQLYEKGQLERSKSSNRRQLITLVFKGCFKKLGLWLSRGLRLIYTSYVTSLALLFLFLQILAQYTLPKVFLAYWVRLGCRSFLWLAGCPFLVQKSKEPLQQCIYVANHSSYLDALLLAAVLSRGVLFVGKKELSHWPLVGHFFKKMDYIFVDRLDIAQSTAVSETMSEALAKGQSLVLFPEGTFTYASGLRPFKIGAFKLAVEQQIPLKPLAICGIRRILRSNSLLMRPGLIRVWVGDFMYPQNTEWMEATRLRSAARQQIADHCGEQAIDLVAAGMEALTNLQV